MSKKEKAISWFKNLIIYPTSIISSPFKGFQKIKDKEAGGFWQATFWIILYGIIKIFEFQYEPFFLNSNNQKLLNGPLIFVGAVLPIILFIWSNYLTTTLFSGSGKFKEIYQVIGFSLYYVIIVRFFTVLISNYTIKSNLALINVVKIISLVIFGVLSFIGLIVIHEFGFFKNFLMILVTLFTFIILLYVIFVVFHLFQQSLGFLEQFIEEIGFRVTS